ncbi:MAG: hypothetical protein PVI23_13385 [Maricaulaceae bacterium]|jgi:hypothetical protein
MKALVVAAMLAASEPARVRAKPKDEDEDLRLRAVRNRFSEADLEDMFGDMSPASHERPPLPQAPEPDFIRWDPSQPPPAETPSDDAPLAA